MHWTHEPRTGGTDGDPSVQGQRLTFGKPVRFSGEATSSVPILQSRRSGRDTSNTESLFYSEYFAAPGATRASEPATVMHNGVNRRLPGYNFQRIDAGSALMLLGRTRRRKATHD
jgi:hypothetical protein